MTVLGKKVRRRSLVSVTRFVLSAVWFLGNLVLRLAPPVQAAPTSAPAAATIGMCDEGSYYDDFDLSASDQRGELHQLLKTTHIRSIPYTITKTNDTHQSDDDLDVWKALMILDAGATNGTVIGIYSQHELSVALAGSSNEGGWNREHLWPQSRGVGEYNSSTNYAFTDLHHLRPSEWNINSARGNKYFGPCDSSGSNSRTNTCSRPATDGTSNDTTMDATTFLPPANVRGDIARALLYMDVRYAASSDPVDLILTDCPTANNSEYAMAYLSQLLQWHQDDPVSNAEKDRNTKVCQMQGNRNPFVDFPFMISEIFGTPQSKPYQCNSNSNNNNPSTPSDASPASSPPTATPARNDDDGDHDTTMTTPAPASTPTPSPEVSPATSSPSAPTPSTSAGGDGESGGSGSSTSEIGGSTTDSTSQSTASHSWSASLLKAWSCVIWASCLVGAWQ